MISKLKLLLSFFIFFQICIESLCSEKVCIFGPDDMLSNTSDKFMGHKLAYINKEYKNKIFCEDVFFEDVKFNKIFSFDKQSTIQTINFCMNMWADSLIDLSGITEQLKYFYDNKLNVTDSIYNLGKKNSIKLNIWVPGKSEYAFFSPLNNSLNFICIPPNLFSNTCRIFDIVCHETGHAFLHKIVPKSRESIFFSALHESFGDISAVNAKIVVSLKNSLFSSKEELKTYILNKQWFGENIGSKGLKRYICNPFHSFGFSDIEMHNMSEAFTQFYFEHMSTSWEVFKHLGQYNIFKIMNKYRIGLLNAILMHHESTGDSLLYKVGSALNKVIQTLFPNDISNNLINIYAERLTKQTHVNIEDPNSTIDIPGAKNSTEESLFSVLDYEKKLWK